MNALFITLIIYAALDVLSAIIILAIAGSRGISPIRMAADFREYFRKRPKYKEHYEPWCDFVGSGLTEDYGLY